MTRKFLLPLILLWSSMLSAWPPRSLFQTSFEQGTKRFELLPADESRLDPSFVAFRRQLERVIQSKDWKKLLKELATPDFASTYERLGVSRDNLWRALTDILRFGLVRT